MASPSTSALSAPSLATARQEVLLEFSALGSSSHCPLGLYVLPLADDPFTWHCVLFVHRGYFASSVLRFTLLIPSTYPSSAPVVTFTTNVFHPLIDPATGRFHLGARFDPWKPRQDFLFHVLHHVKHAFKREALDAVKANECGNHEAWKIYREQTALFAKLASQTAALSITPESLYSPSTSYANSVRFDPGRSITFRPLQHGEEEALGRKLEDEARKKLVASSAARSSTDAGLIA